VRKFFSVIPQIVKKPFVDFLQKRDFNIYNLPLLSSKGVNHQINSEPYKVCGAELIEELELFEKLTKFSTTRWVEKIKHEIK